MSIPSRPGRRPSWPTRAPLSAAALLLAALAACTDTGTAPVVDAPLEASLKRDGNLGAGLLSSGKPKKYRDSSAPHATGRSGSAVLHGRALLAADGTTYLTLTTGDLENLDAAPGEIAKVQVKAYTPEGVKLYTLNFQRPTRGGSVVLPLPGLSRGALIEVQANVRGIDRNRTDVVTLRETVKLSPGLRTDLTLPGQVPAGTPIVIGATVTETGGEVGTWAACELWVDGVRVDRAPSVWVDAGDAVTCAFTHTFARAGDYGVEVRVTGDGGPAGLVAASSGEVSAVSPNAAAFDAAAEDRTVVTTRVNEYRWAMPDGSHKAYRDESGDGVRTQTLSVAGALPRAAVFPLAGVELEVESNGVLYHRESWVALAGAVDGGRLCASRAVAEQGAVFHLCTAGGSTTFGYTRFGGTVTYYSQGYSRTWSGPLGAWTQDVSWNVPTVASNPTGGQARAWGADVAVRIRVTDAGGTFGVSPVVPLAPFDGVLSTTPRACTLEYHYWLEGNAMETCTSGGVREFGVRGTARG